MELLDKGISKGVSLYRKLQLSIVEKSSGTSCEVLNESGFYDVGYMTSRVERAKNELRSVSVRISAERELSDTSKSGEMRLKELSDKKESLIFEIAFLGSNNIKNLDDCLNMIEGRGYAFASCIEALKKYRDGDRSKAFFELESYHRSKGDVKDHFLVNKIYGLLLVENGREDEAVRYLTIALQLLPDDKESLAALKRCYGIQKHSAKERVVSEVMELLG
ncbi:MAG: hypothetical protein K6G24_07875 [Lachnospiraceae bacterium]|nr:hypothetical protein [Lachnospiraceae bacterium]